MNPILSLYIHYIIENTGNFIEHVEFTSSETKEMTNCVEDR